MTFTCPKCQSDQIDAKNYAKKAGGTIGTVAGAAFGAVRIVSGAEIGAAIGWVGGPIGATIGGIAGAVIGGLIGGSVGCTAGAKLGEVVDANILDNYYCLACEYNFSKKPEPVETVDASAQPSYPHHQQRDPPRGYAHYPHYQHHPAYGHEEYLDDPNEEQGFT